jgi:hypothetical protein
MMWRILAVGLVLGATPAEGQRPSRVQVDGLLSTIDRVAREAGGLRSSDGVAYGGGLTIRGGPLVIRGVYLEATLQEEGSASRLRYVEGSASALFQLTPWLSAGPGVRAFRVEEATPERWAYWGMQGRIDLPLIGSMVRGHAAFTEGLSGSVNIASDGIIARNGEVGLTLGLPGSPFELGIANRVDWAEGGGRTRTLQHLEFRVRWMGP